VFDNRYVITQWGDVIDIPHKRLIHKSNGEYIGLAGNRLLIKVCRTEVKGLFAFDLSTRRYKWLKSPDVCRSGGVLSPDNTKTARFKFVSGKNGETVPAFVVEQFGKKRILKGDFKAEGRNGCDMDTVPFVWVDNDRILTQNGNGNLVMLSLDGKVRPLFKLS